MGPLSAKQHREYIKLDAEEQRKNAAFTQEQQRKEQLHQLKLQEAAAKASQGIAHKEDTHAMKLAEGTAKVPRINRQKLGLPSMNPLAGAEVLGQGQKRLPGMVPMGTDTVPAMLTPGEAVIPAPAAQNPKNKKAIRRMVKEGRKKNAQGFSDGTTGVQYYNNGVTGVPFLIGADTNQELYNKGLMSASAFAAEEANRKAMGVPQLQPTLLSTITAENPVPVPNIGRRYGTVADVYAGNDRTPTPVQPVPSPIGTQTNYSQSSSAFSPEELQAQRVTESGNRMKDSQGRYIVSPTGAMGIAQLIPSTAYNPGFGVKPLVGEEIYDENKQIRFQNDYMDAMNKRYGGDKDKAFTAYNAGPGAVDKAIAAATKAGDASKWKDYLPSTEAKEYYGKVMSNMGGRGVVNPEVPAMTGSPSNMPEQPVVGKTEDIPRQLDLAETGTIVAEQDQHQEDMNALDRKIADLSKEYQYDISDLSESAKKMDASPEEKQSWLANAISSLYNEKGTGLFNDQELMRFALVAAGGMLTGGSTGGSLRYAARDVLQSADRRALEERKLKYEERVAQRAEDKALEKALIDEGRDPVEVRKWIKEGQKGSAPAVRLSKIKTGQSSLSTVTTPIKIGNTVLKPGDPIYVYSVTEQYGKRKGETTQIARINGKDYSMDTLSQNNVLLTGWNESTHGDSAKLKRNIDYADKLSDTVDEVLSGNLGAATGKNGAPNPNRQGVPSKSVVAAQIESFYRNKIDMDDPTNRNELKKIAGIAAKQMAEDAKNGINTSNDITPYLNAADIKVRAKLDDSLTQLPNGKQMSASSVSALRDAANIYINKNKVKTSPDSEIERLATVWKTNPNNIQNRYKASDTNTAFALFVLDALKK